MENPRYEPEVSGVEIKSNPNLYFCTEKDTVYDLVRYSRDPDMSIADLVESILESTEYVRAPMKLIASMFCMSTRTFSRRLRKEGVCYREILNNVRTKHAKEMLNDIPRDVISISRELGYSDPSNFSKAFRKSTGLSPRQYRAGQRMRQRQANRKLAY